MTRYKTVWSGEVKAGDTTKVCLPARTSPADLLTDLVRYAIYYQAHHPDKRVWMVVDEHCETCGGSGTRPYSPRLKSLLCPRCKGRCRPADQIGAIPFEMPDPANGIELRVSHKPA